MHLYGSFSSSVIVHEDMNILQIYHVRFPTGERGMRLEKRSVRGRTVQVMLDGAIVQLEEGAESGIEVFNGKIEGKKTNDVGADPEGMDRKFARWLIGLDWSSLLDI